MLLFLSLPPKEAILSLFVCSCFIIIGFIDFKYYLIPTHLILFLYLSLLPKIIFYSLDIMDIIIGALVVGSYLLGCSAIIMIQKKMISVIGVGDILIAFSVV